VPHPSQSHREGWDVYLSETFATEIKKIRTIKGTELTPQLFAPLLSAFIPLITVTPFALDLKRSSSEADALPSPPPQLKPGDEW
jgi:hypothetical protein